MKVKKGDTVEVMSGNDRGKRGEVTHVFPRTGKIMVRGVNMVKKHQKARSQQQLRSTQTGLISVEMPIDASNVKVITPTGNPSRVNYRIEGGEKKRYSNKHGEVIG
jgi:large subunit ribosomal protein L24